MWNLCKWRILKTSFVSLWQAGDYWILRIVYKPHFRRCLSRDFLHACGEIILDTRALFTTSLKWYLLKVAKHWVSVFTDFRFFFVQKNAQHCKACLMDLSFGCANSCGAVLRFSSAIGNERHGFDSQPVDARHLILSRMKGLRQGWALNWSSKIYNMLVVVN